MYSSLRMTTFIPFLLTIFVSTIIAYPAKIDLNEGYYFNRFHDFPDGYEGKDVRNLDGIDHRVPVYEDYGITLVDRTNGKSGGGESTEYRLHNPFSLLFSQTLPASSGSSMHIDGIGGGHLVRNLAAASASASAAARQGGGNLLRDLDQLRNHAAFYARQNRNLDSLSGVTVGNSKRGIDSLNGDSLGNQKRNMDEIDRAGFNSFIKKRNFDEIDHTGFDGFVKRNFDEIDRVGFGSFVKRDAGPYPSHVAVPTQERMRN